jgi:hypothetical protein
MHGVGDDSSAIRRKKKDIELKRIVLAVLTDPAGGHTLQLLTIRIGGYPHVEVFAQTTIKAGRHQ